MKKLYSLFVIMFALAFSLWQPPAVYAQEECRDAAGAVIPCPPTEDPGGGGGGSGGNPNPPTNITATPSLTPSPAPTSTPLPVKDKPTENPTKNAPLEVTPTPLIVVNPSDDSTSEGGEWNGVCKGDRPAKFSCTAKFMQSCESLNGKFEIIKDDGNERHIKCTIPLVADPNALVLVNPGRGDTGGDSWNAFCQFGDQQCLEKHFAYCEADGGLYKVIEFEDIDAAAVHCEIPANANPSGTFPPGGWLPWTAGLGGLLIGLLLPAIQKVREAATRSESPTREHILLANKPDEPQPTKDRG